MNEVFFFLAAAQKNFESTNSGFITYKNLDIFSQTPLGVCDTFSRYKYGGPFAASGTHLWISGQGSVGIPNPIIGFGGRKHKSSSSSRTNEILVHYLVLKRLVDAFSALIFYKLFFRTSNLICEMFPRKYEWHTPAISCSAKSYRFLYKI